MTASQPLSPQIANEFIRDEITKLLHARHVYELGNYGWSGPDDYDSEMIGHAMWQTGSLYFHFLEAHFSATHAPRTRTAGIGALGTVSREIRWRL